MAIISTQMLVTLGNVTFHNTINAMRMNEITSQECENEREQSLEQNPEEHQYLKD